MSPWVQIPPHPPALYAWVLVPPTRLEYAKGDWAHTTIDPVHVCTRRVLAVCMFIAAINGLPTAPAITVWCPTLVKPFFTPPNWLFAPVWFVLYLMIAIAGWRIWVWAGFGRGARALAVYAIQLY